VQGSARRRLAHDIVAAAALPVTHAHRGRVPRRRDPHGAQGTAPAAYAPHPTEFQSESRSAWGLVRPGCSLHPAAGRCASRTGNGRSAGGPPEWQAVCQMCAFTIWATPRHRCGWPPVRTRRWCSGCWGTPPPRWRWTFTGTWWMRACGKPPSWSGAPQGHL